MPRKKTQPTERKPDAKIVRHHDWQDRLNVYLDNCNGERFRWGSHDCLIFAAGAVKAMTGVDLSEGLNAYSDKYEAAQYLREHDYRTLAGAVTAKLGKPVHPAMAGKGDIVLRGKAVGVCAGRWSWFAGEYAQDYLKDGTPIMAHGLVQVPTLDCKAAWKVGPVL